MVKGEMKVDGVDWEFQSLDGNIFEIEISSDEIYTNQHLSISEAKLLADKLNEFIGEGNSFDKVKEMFGKLSEDQRLELSLNYCTGCGGDKGCHCWNDE